MMKKKYTLFYQHIAYALLVSLLLQSCNDELNVFTEERATSIQAHAQPIILQTNINTLVGQELTAQGGHAVNFYQEAGELKADVIVNAPQGFSKTYKRVKAYIEQGTELATLSSLDTKAQERRIHLQLDKGEQPAYLVIYKGVGLKGGMPEGEEEEGEEEAEEEEEEALYQDNNDIPNEFLCPITQELMEKPVVVADGHTYEMSAIQEWFARGNLNSPMTRERLSSTELIPNHNLRKLIQDFQTQNTESKKKDHKINKKGKERLEDENQREENTSSRNTEQVSIGTSSLNAQIIKEEDQKIRRYITDLLNSSGFRRNHEGATPLHLAIRQTAIFLNERLEKLGIDIHNMDSNSIQYLSVSTIRKAYVPAITELIMKDPSAVKAKGRYDWTPLHIAAGAVHDNRELVELLIDQGADKEAKTTDHGYTPLHIAARGGHIEVVKCLVNKRANKDAKTNNGETPLHEAACTGELEIVKYLIEEGANKDAKTNIGSTPLHTATFYKNKKVAQYLVAQGADKYTTDNTGYTLLHTAVETNYRELVELLIEQGANKEAKTDVFGYTPLHIAVDRGRSKVAKYLIDKRVNKEATEKHGRTALYLAARNGHIEIVKYLIDKGANKNAADNDGETSLHPAAFHGHTEVVKYLIDKGINKETKNRFGSKAIDIARERGHQKIVAILSR